MTQQYDGAAGPGAEPPAPGGAAPGVASGPDSGPDSGPARRGPSRRQIIGGAGIGTAGILVGAGAGAAFGREAPASPGGDVVDLDQRHAFYTGLHQAGVQTEPQRYCVYMTFDLTVTTADELKVLLAVWSGAIAQMMAGKPIGAVQPNRPGAVAIDTGEAYELGPSSLTVTLGLGPGVFDERFGLAAKKPKLLTKLPQLPSDNLTPAYTGGDLSLQACADDPQVAYHAIRDLARVARSMANTRWTVLGFGRASAGKGQQTPRNLMGFKDGTRNIKEDADFERFVWVADDVEWMTGGTYQVARKIEMNIENWDADYIGDQQKVFGRHKASGAPLTGEHEFDTPLFTGTHHGGSIDPNAHIALAAHENNDGLRILRRSYNFTDGINEVGQLDAGLLFIAYMSDPNHFVRLQTKLGASDLLNEYISHVGSGVFAVPPAPKQGHFLAEQLFT